MALAALLSSSPSLESGGSGPTAATRRARRPHAPGAPALLGRERPDYPRQGRRRRAAGPNFLLQPGQPSSRHPASQAPSSQGKDQVQTAPPEMPAAGEGFEQSSQAGTINVNFVEVPVTVKDSKGKLVAGLT